MPSAGCVRLRRPWQCTADGRPYASHLRSIAARAPRSSRLLPASPVEARQTTGPDRGTSVFWCADRTRDVAENVFDKFGAASRCGNVRLNRLFSRGAAPTPYLRCAERAEQPLGKRLVG